MTFSKHNTGIDRKWALTGTSSFSPLTGMVERTSYVGRKTRHRRKGES